MTAPIDRIENIRASVDDVERQMQACQAAGVMIPPTLAWRLLSECRSLLANVDAYVSPTPVCGCSCHTMPGSAAHITSCCDYPHLTEEDSCPVNHAEEDCPWHRTKRWS